MILKRAKIAKASAMEILRRYSSLIDVSSRETGAGATRPSPSILWKQGSCNRESRRRDSSSWNTPPQERATVVTRALHCTRLPECRSVLRAAWLLCRISSPLFCSPSDLLNPCCVPFDPADQTRSMTASRYSSYGWLSSACHTHVKHG